MGFSHPAKTKWGLPFLFLLALLMVFLFPQVVLGTRTFFFRDFGLFGFPLAFFHKQALWAGHLPLWNPLSSLGLPFLAQWNTMSLYPGTLLYLLFPLVWALPMFCLLHLVWGGLGMFLLAHRLTRDRSAAAVASIAFTFNGLALQCLMWPNNAAAYGWMPWVIAAVTAACHRRSSLVRAVLLAGLQMLTGAPEFILMTWLLAAVMALAESAIPPCRKPSFPSTACHPQPTPLPLAVQYRATPPNSLPAAQTVKRFALAALLSAAVCASQLLPFLQLLLVSHRQSGMDHPEWAMPPWGPGNFILPLLYTYPAFSGVHLQYGQYWTASYYVGLPILGLAAAAWFLSRRRRHRPGWVPALAALALLAVLLALGKNAFLYHWLTSLLPGLDLIRFPIKLVLIPVFCLPLLAAYSWNQLRIFARRGLALSIRKSLLLIACFLIPLLALLTTANWLWPFPSDVLHTLKWNAAARLFFLILFTSLSWRFLKKHQGRLRPFFILPLLVVWLDLAFHMPTQNPTAPTWIYQPGLVNAHLPADPVPTPGLARAHVTREALQELQYSYIDDPTRFYPSRRTALYSNCNLLEGIAKTDGFFSLYPRWTADVLHILYGQPTERAGSLLDMLSVSHITAPETLFDWQKRPSFQPPLTIGQELAFAPPAVRWLPQTYQSNSSGRVTLDAFDPPDALPRPADPEARLLSQSFTPHQISIRYRSSRPTVLFVAQSYYPNWKAEIDGRPAPILRANHAFQSVLVPSGDHHVLLTYRDTWFLTGTAISISTLLLLLFLHRKIQS